MAEAPFLPDYLHLSDALRVFARFSDKTQSQGHIKPLHQWLSLRLVIEGGFDPTEISPRPPLRSLEIKGGAPKLVFDAEVETHKERTVLGGLKTKDIDVVVDKAEAGPVLAISVKGTTGAFRNLTNRMEEAIGDSTNLHIMYPGLVYGFLQVIRGNREDDAGVGKNDVAMDRDGKVVDAVTRYHHALVELSGRRFVRDDLTRYERVAMALVETESGRTGEVSAVFPEADSPLRLEGFFRFLLETYDLRFPYAGPSLRGLKRKEWALDSPAFADLGGLDSLDTRLGYSPRIAAPNP